MKVELNLPIKRKWFLMIAHGVKKEEYRDCELASGVRLYNAWGRDRDYWRSKPLIVLRNGYRKDSPAIAKYITYLDLRNKETAKHPEWGEPKRKRSHLVFGLGSTVAAGTYAEVKAKLREIISGDGARSKQGDQDE